MPTPSTWDTEARKLLSAARDDRGLATAVVRFHRRLDEVIAQSIAVHAVPVACEAGCSACCHMPVHVKPYEAFALADWMRQNLGAERIAAMRARARENAGRTEAMGWEARTRTTIRCALLSEDGTCGVYEARPAQCRKFNSPRRSICEAAHANPAREDLPTPEHEAVSHNAAVIIAQTRNAARDAGYDAASYELQRALVEAFDNPKARRRWRDGKKAFTGPRVIRVDPPAAPDARRRATASAAIPK